MYFEEEIRYFDYEVLFSLLRDYYSKLNYDIDIKIEEGEYFYPYNLKPKGKPYHIDKYDEKSSVFSLFTTKRELKKVLFPDEHVIVDEIFDYKYYDDMFNNERDNHPIRVIVYRLNFDRKPIEYFEENIEKELSTLENISKQAMDDIIHSITEVPFSIEEKLQIVFLLLTYLFYHKYNIECRVIEYSKFHETLKEYYSQQNCDVEFELSEGESISKYLVKLRDKSYYYDFAIGPSILEGRIELAKALFPNENVRIKRIEQWESDVPYRIYVQPNPEKR